MSLSFFTFFFLRLSFSMVCTRYGGFLRLKKRRTRKKDLVDSNICFSVLWLSLPVPGERGEGRGWILYQNSNFIQKKNLFLMNHDVIFFPDEMSPASRMKKNNNSKAVGNGGAQREGVVCKVGY